MREVIEFRVPEVYAAKFLPRDAGVIDGIARKVVVAATDPLVERIRKIEQLARREGRRFYTAWKVRRRYSSCELDNAELFHIRVRRSFEPAGEECGTVYDESKACPVCGAGAVQVTPLFLDGRRIPKNVDFAETIAGEVVVSERAMRAFRERGLRGILLEPVRLSNKGGELSHANWQLTVIGPPARLSRETRAGEDPFDEDSGGRCARGDVVGLNLLSEVVAEQSGLSDADVLATREYVGVRRGLLRPRPLLLLSRRGWRAVEEETLRGLVVEVARVR